MSATTTNDKVMQLRAMLGQAGEMHFKRIKLAKEIIEDKTWVMTHFAGDEFRAAEVLEKDYFGDLCGAINFWRLIKIVEEFPKLEDWRKYKFNLTEMSAVIDARNKSKRKSGTRWSVSQRDYEELESERNRYRKLFDAKKEECEDKDSRIKQLEDMVANLTREKARLEKQVAEYEQIITAFDLKTAGAA
jgi:hypothetical protein